VIAGQYEAMSSERRRRSGSNTGPNTVKKIICLKERTPGRHCLGSIGAESAAGL
jgi:hypothetical protein